MKGNDTLIAALNELLADELTAISQYMVHSEMCSNWGYGKLHQAIEKQAKEEMHHAEQLIERILFLEGKPVVSKLKPIKIGAVVPEMVSNDQEGEQSAVKMYNEAITLAHEVKDQASVDLLTRILKEEEAHLDWTEIQQTQISDMGLQNYLANQV